MSTVSPFLDIPLAGVALAGELDPAGVDGNVTAIRRPRRGKYVAAALLAAVVVVDQGSKWWAWRMSTSVQMNFGGDVFVGRSVGSWFADPVAGTVFDLLDSIGLLLAFYLLFRRARTSVWAVAGELFLAGWASNVLDRLGLHNWTAPGSRRGVIDFIVLGNDAFNVADLSIVIGMLGLVVASFRSLLRATTFANRKPIQPRRVSSWSAPANLEAGMRLRRCGLSRSVRPKQREDSGYRSLPGDGRVTTRWRT